ncbi:MAG: thermonuclease family protein [Patescibacteria group bacterium]
MVLKWYFRWWAWVIYTLVLVFVIISLGSKKLTTPQPQTNTSVSVPATLATPPISTEATDNFYQVIKVIDGDTITVSKDGVSKTLRLIGINTPETVDPRKPVECFGNEASNKAKELLSGKQVKLEADPTQGELDKYQRTLRYVFLSDGTNFNKLMIEQGFAYEYTYDLSYKYQTEFKQAEKEARAAKRGLWADGVCPIKPASTTPINTQQTVSPPIPDGKYICSRNAYNCSDFKTQAEAQTVFVACGGINNDIHQLDRDKDGEVCESLP